MFIGTVVIIVIYLILSLIFIKKKMFLSYEITNCLYWFFIGVWHIIYHFYIERDVDMKVLRISVVVGCLFIFIGVIRSIGYIVKYHDD